MRPLLHREDCFAKRFQKKIEAKKFNQANNTKTIRSLRHTMPPSRSMPKKIARSQLKSRLYEAFENHWYAMVWEDENGSTMDADIWWDETFEWLKNVPLEKINPAIPFPGPPQLAKPSK